MTILNRVHVVIDVGTERFGGCNSALNLTIASRGTDMFSGTWTGANRLGNGHTVPEGRTGAALVPQDTASRRLLAKLNPPPGPFGARGDPWQSISYESPADEDIYDAPVDTLFLEPSSIRLANTGADLVRPRRIVVWGMADLRLANYPDAPGTVETPVPLAFTPASTTTLSNTFAEGPTSMLLPRTAPWRKADGTQRRVDMVVLTIGLGPNHNASTPAPVTFRIVDKDGVIRMSAALPSFETLRPKDWMTWGLSVTTPFTWDDIMPKPPPPQPCRLLVGGGNAVQIAHVYAFGIDSTTTPNALLPLVHLEGIDPEAWWISAADGDRLLPTANHDTSEVAP